jgi:hypothetical protein
VGGKRWSVVDDGRCRWFTFSFIIWHSSLRDGGVAQLGERLPCTQEVIGSNPFTSTFEGCVVDLGQVQHAGLKGSVVL